LLHQTLKTFNMDRIMDASLTTQEFELPENLAPETVLDNAWKGALDGFITVRLRFRDPGTARRVRRSVWIPGQQPCELPEGGVEWVAQVPDLFELLPWIRGWGSACEIIEPANLQEQLSDLDHSQGDVIMATGELTQTAAETDAIYAELQSLVEGDRFRRCLQCSSCSGICPFGHVMDYPPRRILAALRAQSFSEVLQSGTTWMCVSC
jgi:hypothetical protein